MERRGGHAEGHVLRSRAVLSGMRSRGLGRIVTFLLRRDQAEAVRHRLRLRQGGPAAPDRVASSGTRRERRARFRDRPGFLRTTLIDGMISSERGTALPAGPRGARRRGRPARSWSAGRRDRVGKARRARRPIPPRARRRPATSSAAAPGQILQPTISTRYGCVGSTPRNSRSSAIGRAAGDAQLELAGGASIGRVDRKLLGRDTTASGDESRLRARS